MSATIRVLHIDDEPEFAEVTAAYLQREDERFEVDTALTTMGLDRLDRLDYDCVVSDYDMPHTNGIELLENIREQHPNLPFILFTGKGSEEIASQAVSHGVTEYLPKGGPEVYSELAERIVDAVETYRRVQRIRRYESLLENATDVVCVTTLTGEITFASPASSDLVGYDPGEIEGEELFDLVHPEDREAVVETHETLATSPPGDTARVSARMRHADGSWVRIEHRCRRVADDPDDAGVVLALREFPARDADDALDTTEKRYARILAHSSDYVVIVDEVGAVSYVSPAIERVMGFEPAELVGTNAFEYVHPDYREPARRAFEEVLADPEAEITVEYPARNADGDWIWIEARGSNRLADPVLHGVLVNVRDIHEKKRQEQALREEQAFVEQTLNALEDLFYVVSADGRLLRWNERVKEMTGYSDAELDGMNVMTLLPESAHERVAESMECALETGSDSINVEVVSKDDSRIPTEFTGVRLTDPDGAVVGIAGIGRDLTERKARQAQLERNETILEALRDPVYALDADGRFTYANDALATLTGYDREELLGEPVSLVLPEYAVERGNRLVAELLEEDDEHDRQTAVMDVLSAAGQRIPHEIHMAVLPFDETGTFRGTAGVARDVSNRIARERALKRQNERLEKFAGIVSHDLRNPLQNAVVRTSLAKEECDSEHLDVVEQAHEDMRRLIDHLLTIAREGEGAATVDPVDLEELATTCWDSVRPSEATLRVETGRVIFADETRFRQVLENLMRNAVEHAGRDVTVVVGDLPDGDGFYVEDDGPGIPEAERARVFESGHTLSGDGSGLGLDIVEGIVEDHGWSVRLTDGELGGARFEFSDVPMAE